MKFSNLNLMQIIIWIFSFISNPSELNYTLPTTTTNGYNWNIWIKMYPLEKCSAKFQQTNPPNYKLMDKRKKRIYLGLVKFLL